jgi:hypothetical protein
MQNLSFNPFPEAELNMTMLTILVIPECFYLTTFLLGIYGMYQGIEIQHPL